MAATTSARLVAQSKRPRLIPSSSKSLDAAPSRIGAQRFLQSTRDWNRFQPLPFSNHARDLLLAARDQLFVAVSAAKVFERHGDAILRERAEAHAYQHLVERRQLREVFTRASRRYQA